MEPTENVRPASTRGILALLAGVTQFFVTLLMVVMTVIISWQIFGRYVLNDTPKWSEQLAGVLMVYMTLLGGALAVRDGGHISLTYFRDRWSAPVRTRAQLLTWVLIGAFGVLMAVYGVRMALLVKAWTIPTLGVSQSVNYWSFPVAGVLIVLFAADRLRRRDLGE